MSVTTINIFRNSKNAQPFVAGEKIFDVGDTGDKMYAVVQGAVRIEIDGREVDYLEPGSIFGEMALIDDSPRSAAAVAAENSQIVPVDRRQFEFLVHNHPSFALQVMAVMAERLRRKIPKPTTE